jgi:hypothetical protein
LSALSLILFPYCRIPARDLERVLGLFGGLSIALPWHMDWPLSLPREDCAGLVDVLRPSSDQKPPEDFRGLLAEYRLWMTQNRDRGYASFLNATQKGGPSEETPWEIRKLITGSSRQDSPDAELNLKRHLILHLAEELERSREEMDEMLDRVKREKSPLEGALEDEAPAGGLLDDLPRLDSDSLADERHMGQVFDAWHGLFGPLVPSHALLITPDPRVMHYARGLFEDKGSGDNTVRLRLPDMSGLSLKELRDREADGQKALQRLAQGLHAGENLQELLSGSKALMPPSPTEKEVTALIHRFPHVEGERACEPVAGRTLILLTPGSIAP